MLVDDEDFLRDVLAEQLEDSGFRVIVAADGPEAFMRLESETRIQALITDLSMPGMDGLALIRAIREQRPHLPAILLTGFPGDFDELRSRQRDTGEFTLMHKPARLHEIVATLRSLLVAGETAS
jgi:CheY-like chemotaxis protein